MATQGNNTGNQNNSKQEKVEIDVGNAHVEITEGGGGQAAGGSSRSSSSSSQSGGNRSTASNGQGSTDNRGKVLHPETDGRLKGNEAHRPNDPDRSAQAEGGRRGGQNSHRNDSDR